MILKKVNTFYRKIMKRNVTFYIVIIGLLLLSRFLDFNVFFNLANKEFNHLMKLTDFKKINSKIYYESVGFNNLKNLTDRILKLANEKKEKILIIHFFDFVCPSKYIIYSKGLDRRIEIPFPWEIFLKNLIKERGLIFVNVYKFDYIEISNKKSKIKKVIPVVGSLFSPLYNFFIYGEESLHFFLDNSIFMRTIYCLYFYIPFLIILILSQKYKLHLAYLYFVIMPFLFNMKYFCYYGPTFGLPLHFDDSFFTGLIGLLIFIYFYYFIIKNAHKGFKLRKDQNLKLKEKLIILYFLLLPFFLRF